MTTADRKPVTPYARLLATFREYAQGVEYRRKVSMWMYPRARLRENWRVDDLYERTQAAEQLGYDVMLIANEDGLLVKYVKKVPDRPSETL